MSNVEAKSDALDAKLDAGLDDEINQLFEFSRRTRQITYLLIAVVMLSALSWIGVGYIAVQARNTSHIAASTKHDQFIICEAGNKARASNLALWNYILALPSVTPPNPDQQQQITAFRTFLAAAFQNIDCANPEAH